MLRVLTGSAVEHDWNLIFVCFVGLLLGAIILFYRRRSGKDRLVSLALNNMTQGVVMFDSTGKLAVCNDFIQ